jgi:hypothetical protein
MELIDRSFIARSPGAATPATILGIGLSDADVAAIEATSHDGPLRAVLVNGPEVEHGDTCDPQRAATRILRALSDKNIRIDGIVSCDDYPCCLVASHIARELRLASPSLSSLLLLQHKYWSRTIQARTAAAHTPGFDAIDLRTQTRVRGNALAFPCWVKPIKSSMSFLALRAATQEQLSRNLRAINERMNGFQFAFNASLGALAAKPPGLPAMDGEHAIVEEEIKGHQVTLEGYVAHGQAMALGVVDSYRTANRRSFARFQYPSRLSRKTQDELLRIAGAVLADAGFDNGFFNVEFFVDTAARDIKILEINPRFCSQFSNLYHLVDGQNSHRALVALALGRPIAHRRGQGAHRMAACFVLRRKVDARVVRVPTAAAIRAAERLYPGSRVDLLCEPGRLLSDYVQDEFSYRYACIYVGADRRDDLHARYARIRDRLTFGFDPRDAPEPPRASSPITASIRPR